jgi:hypothetical protein
MVDITPSEIAFATAILSAGIAWGVARAEGRRNAIEIESIKRLITGSNGQSVFVLRAECENSYAEVCRRSDRASAETRRMFEALGLRLSSMDEKRDKAREQDRIAFEMIRTDISLIKQRISLVNDQDGD